MTKKFVFDPELKAQWVAALRSGDYKQGRDVLREPTRDGMSYCCLGVLCEVMIKNKSELVKLEPNSPSYRFATPYGGVCNNMNIHDPVRVKIGLTNNMQKTLQRKNDSGKSFEHIADYIEKKL